MNRRLSPDRTTPTPYASRVSSSSSGAVEREAPVLDRAQLLRALSDAGRNLFVRSLSSQSDTGAADVAAPTLGYAVTGEALTSTLSGESFTGEPLSALRGTGTEDVGDDRSAYEVHSAKASAAASSFPASLLNVSVKLVGTEVGIRKGGEEIKLGAVGAGGRAMTVRQLREEAADLARRPWKTIKLMAKGEEGDGKRKQRIDKRGRDGEERFVHELCAVLFAEKIREKAAAAAARGERLVSIKLKVWVKPAKKGKGAAGVGDQLQIRTVRRE